MKRSVLAALVLSFMIGGSTVGAAVSEAHGYISSPGSRAYLGSSLGGRLNTNVGRAEWEPYSIEAPKNTFITGKLASAGVYGFDPLDEQTADRWVKTDIKTGPLAVTWTLTAPHRTATWNYYMTKQGWNPNQLLDIKNFDPIGSVNDNGAMPGDNVYHTITVPSDRKGYHIIYAVWNVYDTGNAFYQAIDVNVK